MEPPTLRLFPGTTGTVELTFAPPRTPDATAGPNPYAVRITPTEHPEATTVPEGNLTITPFTELRAELVPPTVKGRFRGRPRLAIDNLGNTKVTASLNGSDNGDQLSVRHPPQQHPDRTRPRRVRHHHAEAAEDHLVRIQGATALHARRPALGHRAAPRRRDLRPARLPAPVARHLLRPSWPSRSPSSPSGSPTSPPVTTGTTAQAAASGAALAPTAQPHPLGNLATPPPAPTTPDRPADREAQVRGIGRRRGPLPRSRRRSPRSPRWTAWPRPTRQGGTSATAPAIKGQQNWQEPVLRRHRRPATARTRRSWRSTSPWTASAPRRPTPTSTTRNSTNGKGVWQYGGLDEVDRRRQGQLHRQHQAGRPGHVGLRHRSRYRADPPERPLQRFRREGPRRCARTHRRRGTSAARSTTTRRLKWSSSPYRPLSSDLAHDRQ